MAIVDQWEQTHQRRLLTTSDAGRLVQLIASGLEVAFQRGTGSDGVDPEPDTDSDARSR
ncbi:MAG TPA: hypothetical protein VGL99_18815 [Chloroflexota bacterium]|jgi:hypothetical protein